MAFIPTFGTGWETGSPHEEAQSGISVSVASKMTGAYGLEVAAGGGSKWWETVEVPSSKIYVAFWTAPRRTDTRSGIFQVKISGSYFVDIRPEASGPGIVWSAYVNAVKVATGSIPLVTTEWHHVQMYVHSADVGGRIITQIDGLPDIDYTGDTGPAGGTTIQTFRIYGAGGGSGNNGYIDDLIIGYSDLASEDDWPGDYRFDALFTMGNSGVQWTPTGGGGLNWDCVDERPPSEVDYVSTVTTDHKDKYTLTDWDEANKTPRIVVTWAYAKKSDASASKLKLVLDDGTEDIGVGQDLLTTADYVKRIDLTKPSGGAWTNAALDALLAGIQAEIP